MVLKNFVNFVSPPRIELESQPPPRKSPSAITGQGGFARRLPCIKFGCVPGLIRTVNLLLRREMFCPIELRGQILVQGPLSYGDWPFFRN